MHSLVKCGLLLADSAAATLVYTWLTSPTKRIDPSQSLDSVGSELKPSSPAEESKKERDSDSDIAAEKLSATQVANAVEPDEVAVIVVEQNEVPVIDVELSEVPVIVVDGERQQC